MHYHVTANTTGYLPVGDPGTTETASQAEALARSCASAYREELGGVTLHIGKSGSGQTGYIHCERPADPHHLTYVIEWDRCREQDCTAEQEA